MAAECIWFELGGEYRLSLRVAFLCFLPSTTLCVGQTQDEKELYEGWVHSIGRSV